MERIKEIEKRLSEIAVEINGENADLDALENEIRALKAEKAQIEQAAEKREKLLADIAGGSVGNVTKRFSKAEEKEYNASSPEYKSAWLKNLAVDGRGKKLFGELNAEERAAFTFTTANTGAVVPTEIMDRIVTLIDNDSPMYDDAAKSNFAFGFEVPRLKAITAGDAKVVTEGAANDDENDTFDKISRKMQFQSIQAFEDWVVTHLAERVRVAKENYILTQLGKSSTVGIDTANVLTGTALTDDEIRKALGQLRGSGERVLYANSTMIWGTIAGLKDTDGNALFIPSAMVDPTIEGRVYGTTIKRDSNIPDDTIYIGYPNKILANEFITFDVTPQIEAKTLNRIFVGYSLFDAALEDPKAFVKWTKSAG